MVVQILGSYISMRRCIRTHYLFLPVLHKPNDQKLRLIHTNYTDFFPGSFNYSKQICFNYNTKLHLNLKSQIQNLDNLLSQNIQCLQLILLLYYMRVFKTIEVIIQMKLHLYFHEIINEHSVKHARAKVHSQCTRYIV